MARLGRPPKSLKIHRLEGTLNATRHGGKAEPEAPGDLASKAPPEWLTEAQRERWTETLLDAPRDLLRRIDWDVFSAYIQIADQHMRAILAQRELDRGQQLPFLVKTKDGPRLSPYLRTINHCVLLMVRLQTEMGFTPSSRARFRTVEKDDNETTRTGWDLLDSLRVVEGGRKD